MADRRVAAGPADAPARDRRRFEPARLHPPAGPRLVSGLAAEHARTPFTPRDPRSAARRVVQVARDLGLSATPIRGGVDVGAAELDHVWVAVADEVVVDVVLPLHSERFAAALRCYVAGDLAADELDRMAHGYALQWRVIGRFPDDYRYVGAPIWGAELPATASA